VRRLATEAFFVDGLMGERTAPGLSRGRSAMRGPEPFFTERDSAQLARATFEDFPYLIVHPAVGINHIHLLPDSLDLRTLFWIAEQQRTANRLPVTLALSREGWVFHPEERGAMDESTNPFPGFPITGDIEACTRFRATPARRDRIERLERFVRRNPMRGFRFGDPWKGGRAATTEEGQWLFGRQPSGVPAGLTQCEDCGEWKGRCLDPDLRETFGEEFPVTVRCRCENWNRCARCHRDLAGRRLNSNWFDPLRGRIRFVSGTLALEHRC
jgi:hypothetical protein